MSSDITTNFAVGDRVKLSKKFLTKLHRDGDEAAVASWNLVNGNAEGVVAAHDDLTYALSFLLAPMVPVQFGNDDLGPIPMSPEELELVE